MIPQAGRFLDTMNLKGLLNLENGGIILFVLLPYLIYQRESKGRQMEKFTEATQKREWGGEKPTTIIFNKSCNLVSIESVGIIPPGDLLKKSLQVLIAKANEVKTSLIKILDPEAEVEEDVEPMEAEEQAAENGEEGGQEEEDMDDAEEEEEEEEELVHEGRDKGEDSPWPGPFFFFNRKEN